jgi:hypothetical protein
MAEEKKNDGTRDPLKMFLKESLTQQRNEMMDNFVQILQHDNQHATHLPQTEAPPPSRYK